MTITGANFSDVKLDNAVTIGDAGCLVQSASSTEIVCKSLPRPDITDFSPETVAVSVFLKLSETATCAADACTFTFEEPSAEVTGLSVAYD